jgi:hypothetical protein
MAEATQPRRTIRRFDIFAEWNRLKAREKLKLSAGESRAYGLAVAKVVAGRKQRRDAGNAPEPKEKPEAKDSEAKDTANERWWQHLGSDDEFRRVVVRRMGEDFYKDVFAPAVRKAWDAGKDYTDIRDTLRTPWNETLDAAKA